MDNINKGNSENSQKENATKHDCKIIDFKLRNKISCHTQPEFDKPLSFSLSPNQIHRCILYECGSFMTLRESLINPEIMTKQIRAGNDENYCWLVANDWNELNEEHPFGMDCCSSVVLEIKIGDAYLFAEYGRYRNDYHITLENDDWRRGEEAFIKIAAILGIRVTRGLVIGKPESWE